VWPLFSPILILFKPSYSTCAYFPFLILIYVRLINMTRITFMLKLCHPNGWKFYMQFSFINLPFKSRYFLFCFVYICQNEQDYNTWRKHYIILMQLCNIFDIFQVCFIPKVKLFLKSGFNLTRSSV